MGKKKNSISVTQPSRMSGILLHPTSLPSKYGIGDLGTEAYRFVDFLEMAGQHLWQVLPLTHTGYGDSPYQSFSAFAGQPLLISPENLLELGLISLETLNSCPKGDPEHIDYGALIPWKTAVLKEAYDIYKKKLPKKLTEKFALFCYENAFWLDDYALFMACKDENGGKSWLDFKEPYRSPSKKEKMKLLNQLSDSVRYYQFIQFLFFRQWKKLKKYANKHGVSIIGDIPIFVSMDSADVWANKSLFQLDEDGYPTAVAGVPPDYFSETGQLWGNPLYQWGTHKHDGYSWWIKRIRNQLDLLDYLRIDHFRGFESYWSVPYGSETAIDGEWKKGPDKSLFKAFQKTFGKNLPIIAEDLGIITPEVEALRDRFGFPGMKILQFAFESTVESSYLPHQFTTPNCVCYTGTHDNDTTAGWYQTLNSDAKKKVKAYMQTDGSEISAAFIRTCIASTASIAVFPMQDALGLGSDARMNTPGVSSGNWDWRLRPGSLSPTLAQQLKELTILYGRY